MSEIEGKTIEGLRGAAVQLSDLAISNCTFDNCLLRPQSISGAWNSIRNVALRNVKQKSCSVYTSKIETCSIHNLRVHGRHPLIMWGCVYSETSLSGKIGFIKINRSVGLNEAAETAQPLWDKAMREFYAGVDWALDISNAKFTSSVSFEAVPGDKIRRDPETQVLVTRDGLSKMDWRQLNYGNSGFGVAIDWFLHGSLFDSTVLAARTGGRETRSDIEVLCMLRKHGIAS